MSGQTAIIVVNFHSAELLEQNISAELSAAALTVVVVDNSSPDARQLSAERGWHYIPCDSNIGFGAACNLGARFATETGALNLLFLNPDASLSPRDLESLEEALGATPAAVVAPRILTPDGRAWFEGAAINRCLGVAHHSDSGTVEWVTGACMMWRADLFARTGGFDESYFLYWEDVELSVRARRAGAQLIVVSAATAMHAVGGSQRADSGKSTLYYRQNIRNRMLYAGKHESRRMARWWWLTTPLYLLTLIRRAGVLRRPKRLLAEVRKVCAAIRS